MVKLKWSQYIPHDPHPKQITALSDLSRELLFGGALGGGKSDFLLMCGTQFADVPGYASIIFRKNITDAKLPGALLDRAMSWLSPWLKNRQFPNRPVKYEPSDHTFKFETRAPDGSFGEPAKLCFGYIGEANVKERYQSAEFQTICFDELSHWPTDSDYVYLTTRLRKNVCTKHGKLDNGDANYVKGCMECDLKKASPTRMRAATNPGMQWIKHRWQIIPDPSIYPDKRDAIQAIMQGVRVPFVGTHPKRKFVPSLIEDNPSLDQSEYNEFLDALPDEERSQLRDGNWEARADSRFKRAWVKYYELYPNAIRLGEQLFPMSFFKRIFSTVDCAGTKDEGMIDQKISSKPRAPSFTVISTWGVSRDNRLFWLNMVRFRDEIPEVVDKIAEVFGIYHPQYVKIEINGVGLGIGQYVTKLGIPVKKLFKGSDKLENSTAALLLMKSGRIYLPNNAPWIDECEDEVFNWTGLPVEQDDIVDTLSDAAVDIGPTTDVLDPTVAKNIRSVIKIDRTPMLRNPQLRFGSALANRLSGVNTPKTPIRDEMF